MYAIGIDIADKTFTASCVAPPPTFDRLFFGQTLEQNDAGYQGLLNLLSFQQILIDQASIIMEATGVYSERLCHFLHAHGFLIYVEPPLSIRKGFYEKEKTDPVDSAQIGEYFFRFGDRLHPWYPPDVIIDQIATLLSSRELLVKMQTAGKNSRKSLKRKQNDMVKAKDVQDQLVEKLDHWIDDLEGEIETLLKTKPLIYQTYVNLKSTPNVGKLLSMNMAVITNGFTQHLKYQSIAKYVGIYPVRFQSGTSVYRPPSSDGAGSERLHKLLYLAAMRLRKDSPVFGRYFERKVAEGKSKKLVLNNIANKLLRLMCGVIKSGKPFMKDYQSVNPTVFD